jgi:ElaB/YqjD/DUF883 family membrane-anchored ribosome-binding protein
MTDFIIRPRAGGKTTEILERMREDKRIVMVCATNSMADIHRRAARRAQEVPGAAPGYVGIEPWRFVPATSAAFGTGSALTGRDVTLAFDNVELILAGIFQRPIDSISGTDESYS